MVRSAVLLRFLWLLVLSVWAFGAQASSVVTTPQVRAELVAHAPEGIAPGKSFWLGLLIRHQPGWHTYWRNPGDSGLPTMLTWVLPAGVKAGDIDWPAPHRLPFGSLVNYGYEETIVLPVPVQVDADFGGKQVDVQLRADWLVCKVECIPESGEFRLTLPTHASVVTHRAAFEAAFAAQPVTLPDVTATASIPNRAFSSPVHCSTRCGGHSTEKASTSPRSINSRKIRPASIVLPMPTSSATSRRGTGRRRAISRGTS